MSESLPTRKPHGGRYAALCLTLLLAAALTLAACGGSDADGGSPAPDYDRMLAGAPAPLAALHEQSDQLLDGGKSAFDKRLEQLRGYPVVVNLWASWCGPCLIEFPHFQQVSARMGKQVAFVGVDVEDDADSAATFLRDNPVPYPSYSDPDKDIAYSLDATHGLPATAFFDAEGELTLTKTGQYTDSEQLEADVRKYAVQGRSG